MLNLTWVKAVPLALYGSLVGDVPAEVSFTALDGGARKYTITTPITLVLYYSGRTRSFPRQLTVALHIQWRIVIKGDKMVTVDRKSLVFGACVGHLQDQGSTHLGPPMRKREGGVEKWTAPDVLKGLENPKERKTRERARKKTRAGRFGKRSKEDPGVLDRDADQES
ncbi:hypothetical protein TNCV_620261 [Trichonephila clavipes]|nr:hypothetical protein TNCV_620261 [Trichonephila clavipes]